MSEEINAELSPLPEGVDILKSDSSGKLFVINEVLNFYQRKLQVLNRNVVNNLAHNQFQTTELEKFKP